MWVIGSRDRAREHAGRGRRLVGAAAGLVAVVMLASACGGDSEAGGKKKADAGGGGGMAAYAKCMRENGVKDFPDPGSGGKIDLNGNTIDTNSEQFKAADEKCKSHLPEGGDAAPPEEVREAQIKYAKCMRENGVPKFPDPNSDGGIDINGDTLGVDPMGPVFKAADKKCKKHLEKVAGGPRIERNGP